VTPWTVRDEQPGDEPAIAALTEAAFRDASHSDGTEAEIVARLRAEGDLALSLVLVNEDQAIIGHAAFSPVTISDGAPGWYGLGPVSVLPLRQRTGFGSALIEHGLARLRAMNARGCVVLGDPRYYGRFGFRHDPRLAFPGPPAEYFQVLGFVGAVPDGIVRYAPAFGQNPS
jgi:putative acetyltransferase